MTFLPKTLAALPKTLAVMLLIPWAVAGFAAGNGSGGAVNPAPATMTPRTPERIALRHYKAGVRHKEKAWKNEVKATGAKTEKKRDKYLAKAQKEYVKAIDRQREALGAVGNFADAANELGYAYRKTGDYDKALIAYRHALELKPDFAQAKEYLAEAYLALGRYDETKALYMDLFRSDGEMASELMQAMAAWVGTDAASTDTAAQAFATWVKERQVAAQVTRATADPNAWANADG